MTIRLMITLPSRYAQLFTRHPESPLINGIMIFTAEYLVYLIPLTLLFFWFTPNKERSSSVIQRVFPLSLSTKDGKSKAIFIFATIIVSLAFSYAMGQLYNHPAPYMGGYNTLLTETPENSFPSQHTTVMFAFAWSLLSLHDRLRVGLLALAFALLVGISRVYVGVHYPIDIIGGIGVSLLGFTLVYAAKDLVGNSTIVYPY